MTLPVTPSEWLPVLLESLDKQATEISKPRRYAAGQPDLPEMGRNVRESWLRYQRKAVTDFGGLAVDSLCDRLIPQGVRIGESDSHPALPAVRRIWRDNRLSVQIPESIRDAIEAGVGYLLTERAEDSSAIVSRELPEQFYADPDPIRPWKGRAWVKVWRDSRAKIDYAQVWANGQTERFLRRAVTDSGSWVYGVSSKGWVTTGDLAPSMATVSIFDRPGRKSALETHIPLIDQLIEGKLQRLTTAALQAFRQRALIPKVDSGGLPEEDSDGNQIDWAKVLEPAPGAIWDFPVPIDIWESAATDIRPLLEAEKHDMRTFAAVTGTPIAMLMPEQESATGAAQLPMQLVFRARAEIERLKPSLNVALVRALEIEGEDLGSDTLESLWANPEYVTVTERFSAAVNAKGAGLSERTIKRDILGMTPDQIKQDEADKGSDMLAAALMGVTSGSNNGTTQSPDPGRAASTPADS